MWYPIGSAYYLARLAENGRGIVLILIAAVIIGVLAWRRPRGWVVWSLVVVIAAAALAALSEDRDRDRNKNLSAGNQISRSDQVRNPKQDQEVRNLQVVKNYHEENPYV